MNLHTKPEFDELCSIVSMNKGIPKPAIIRDYFIVRSLQLLSESEYCNNCVFKGGTSLSKCYPGSINRFSEDIDLTFVPSDDLSEKQIERRLKTIEKLMTDGAVTEIIPDERNTRNKSIWFWFDDETDKIKLEIGSSVRPEPYNLKYVKTFIQEYLEENGFTDEIEEFGLKEVGINTLAIERTFTDKLMAVKRHAICGSLARKSRHIYDVVSLYKMNEIKSFLSDEDTLRRIIRLTKDTDSFYFDKRNVPEFYVPTGPYNFPDWKNEFFDAEKPYQKLHEYLLYTNEKQSFIEAVDTFETISKLLKNIGE